MVSLLAGGGTNPASTSKGIFSASSDGEGLTVYFFTGKGCPHCAKVEPFIAEMEQKYPIHLSKFDIYTNRSCLPLLDEYSSSFGIALGERSIPAVFVSDTYLVGDSPILNGLEDAVKKSLNERPPTNQNLEVKNSENSDQKVTSVVSNLSIVTLTAAALVDAINPCSIAILVFLIGARVLISNQRKRALKVGLSFCLSIFIAYFLFGLGLLTVVQVSGFSGTFSMLVGLVALLSGIFYLKDVFWRGRGGFAMEVPRSLKPLLMKMLKGVTNPFGAFIMGFVVCLFEVPCTGGPYLFILGLMADSATRIQAIPLLLYYNFIFVLPLSIICLLLYSNFFSTSKMREWNEKNKRLLRLAGGFAMIALAFLTIPVSPMLQLIQLLLLCFKVAGPPVLVIAFFYLALLSAKGKSLASRFPRLPKGAIMVCLMATAMFIAQTPAMHASGEDELPVANAGSDQTVLLGESVTFDGSESYDLDGIIISYEWDFGDPIDLTLGTGVNPTHTYLQSSVYVVTLTVIDDAGWESSDTMTVVVEDKIFMLELNYDSGFLSLRDVYKKAGFAPDRRIQPESGHTAQVVSKSEKTLYTFTFDIPNVWQYDYADGDVLAGDSVELDETEFTLVMPAFESAAWINLYYPDETLALSVNVEGIPELGGSNCQTSTYSGLSSLNFDIVFVGDNYTTAQLSQFATDVIAHESTLLSVPPFSNHSGSINVHWVNESRNLGCQYGNPPMQRLITCNPTAVLNLATQCPADEVIVLVNSNTFGGSGLRSPAGLSSYAVAYSGIDTTLTPPTDWSGDRVTVHEFGHSFGNLHDEYNGSTTSTSNPNGPNCDLQPCTRWAGLNLSITCNQGCTNSNWYSGDNGQGDVMKTVTRLQFGPVCRYYLNGNLSSYPRSSCGGATPCQCGDVLTQSRTLNSSDFNGGPCSGIGLEIGAPNITLDGNGRPIIGGVGGTGILSAFNNVTIKNSNVSGFTNGIHVLGASNNTILNNTITTIPAIPLAGSGLWIQYSTNNNVTSNTASLFKWGIALDTNSNNNVIENNTVSSCQYGIELYSSSGNTIEDTMANNNTDHGIYLRASSSNNRINNSTADFNFQHGLYLSDLTSISNNVTNCRFCDNNQTGLGYYDIFDADANIGINNRCGTSSNWADAGAASGCTFSCRTNTTTYVNSSIGVIAIVGSTWAATPITVLISNVTSAAFIANATASVAANRTIGLYANVSLKCPPIDWAYLQIDYDESNLIFDESTLQMYRWNYMISNWTLIPNSGVNTSANYVWANVTHLSIFTGIGRPPTAHVHINPDTFNLKTTMNWVTGYIELPEGYDVMDIDATTILLNGTIPPELDPRYGFVTDPDEYITDYNNDAILERMVKFDKDEVKSLIMDYLDLNGWRFRDITLTVSGEFYDGTQFEGSDSIRVIVCDVNGDNAVDILDLTIVSLSYGLLEDEPDYNPEADINEDGAVEMRDLSLVAKNLGAEA